MTLRRACLSDIPQIIVEFAQAGIIAAWLVFSHDHWSCYINTVRIRLYLPFTLQVIWEFPTSIAFKFSRFIQNILFHIIKVRMQLHLCKIVTNSKTSHHRQKHHWWSSKHKSSYNCMFSIIFFYNCISYNCSFSYKNQY